MITVSSITKNTGRYAMIRTAFFIFLSIYYIMLLAMMHHTGKKEIFRKRKKKKVTKNLLQGDSSPDPQNQLELKRVVSNGK